MALAISGIHPCNEQSVSGNVYSPIELDIYVGKTESEKTLLGVLDFLEEFAHAGKF